MKYFFEALTEPIVGQKIEDGKKLKDPIEIHISIEIERSKFETLNKKYTEGLSGRILKIFK